MYRLINEYMALTYPSSTQTWLGRPQLMGAHAQARQLVYAQALR